MSHAALAVGAAVPQAKVWTLGWTALQRLVIILAKAGYLPIVQLLLLPLDCTALPDGGYSLDADPSQRCWDSVGHVLSAVAGFVGAVLYTAIAARVVLAGGQLANVEIRLTRLWDRSYDTFTPQVRANCCCALHAPTARVASHHLTRFLLSSTRTPRAQWTSCSRARRWR